MLRESDNTSIGVHVYGGAINSASVIGIYGNQFLDYVAAFDLKPMTVPLPGRPTTSTPGFYYVQVPTSKTPDVNEGLVDLTGMNLGRFSAQTGFQHLDNLKEHSAPTEGFFDTF